MAADKHSKDIDSVTGTETTGHEWDGIKELNTPLPRWWLYVFYACIVWSVGYWVFYPAWPTASGYTAGVLGYSTRAAVRQDMDDLRSQRAVQSARLETASLDDIRQNAALRTFALAQGRAAFGDNCAPCHGTGAAGGTGYPNLNDDDWMWGGRLEAIAQTIRFGIRNDHPETRQGPMPAFGRDGVLNAGQIRDVTAHVLTLSGRAPEGGNAQAGATLFAEQCAACHGDAGRGNPDLGAPNLADGIWLYGGSTAAIIESIQNGRGGVMPHFATRLDPVTVKALAVYVHNLGGGQ